MKVDPWRNLASIKKLSKVHTHDVIVSIIGSSKIEMNVPVEPLDSTSMCLDDESNNTPCFGGVMI